VKDTENGKRRGKDTFKRKEGRKVDVPEGYRRNVSALSPSLYSVGKKKRTDKT